uniref:Protein kinase domain-containing protein n=2 Tax=Caenorhabditis japonica TaxID=281687 RepID=A0A8R1DK04_CAEJA
MGGRMGVIRRGSDVTSHVSTSKCAAGPPCLQHFSVIRSIGRGAFGKVCIVQERKTKKYFALKYMNKRRCIEKGVAANVIRELTLLSKISHPFIVNLWYTFQDPDYMYMVSDLLLGGDLRYHLSQQGKFAEDRAKLYLCEICLAVDYLHQMKIVHRDIKPENILLDEQGHAHLTDLNLATQLEHDELATSYSGTRPYMAPEIYATYLGMEDGYDSRVDWWALGVCFYEMLRGRTPFEFSSRTKPEEAYVTFREFQITYPAHWPTDLIQFLNTTLKFEKDKRIVGLDAIKRHAYTERIDFNSVYNRKPAPVFIPCKEGLNCDPMYELEERILVSTPIHRRRNTNHNSSGRSSSEPHNAALAEVSKAFIDFSRHTMKQNESNGVCKSAT